jgi:subtilase family serine protease
VSAAGAYFLFPDDVYRGGTSFAAPLVSLMIAVDLTNQTPLCAVQSNGRIELLNPGRYENTALTQAATGRCR